MHQSHVGERFGSTGGDFLDGEATVVDGGDPTAPREGYGTHQTLIVDVDDEG